jgi:hypothetical protein
MLVIVVGERRLRPVLAGRALSPPPVLDACLRRAFVLIFYRGGRRCRRADAMETRALCYAAPPANKSPPVMGRIHPSRAHLLHCGKTILRQQMLRCGRVPGSC